MTALSDLITRLEAAKEGSREIDVAIGVATGYRERGKLASEFVEEHPDADISHWSIPHYTTSLDAALTLVPTGWSEEIKRSSHRLGWRVNLWFDALNPGRDAIQSADAPTGALALCIAALKAREAGR